MSAIHNALSKLDGAVAKLESATGNLEEQQQDMFGEQENHSKSNGSGVDSAMVAQRLDQAIDRVEKILEKETA